jgi:hypothetical protein
MKAVVSVSLGLVFVGLATLNVITILESSRSGQTSRKRVRAIALHRAGGYLFIALFALMVWFMSKRLIGSREGISADAAVHVDLAILLAPLLFVKVMIARKYKSYHSILMPLGLSIYVISSCSYSSVLPHALSKINPSTSIANTRASIVLFCVSMARLALRPPGSSPTKAPTASLSSQPVSKPAPKHFSLELVHGEVQTRCQNALFSRSTG